MINEQLRGELVAMRHEDRRVREELMASGELGGGYVPRMEEVHRRNVARLRELIRHHGWPSEGIAEKDGAEAAWLIAQHAVGEPPFQREALRLLRACAAQGGVPAWHGGYLKDRVALNEGRPQRFGTQWVDDPRDGRPRPWKLSEPQRINELRREVGLGPMPPVPEPGPDLPPHQRERAEQIDRWWQEWLKSKGWRDGL